MAHLHLQTRLSELKEARSAVESFTSPDHQNMTASLDQRIGCLQRRLVQIGSPFLNRPAELCNRIYELAVVFSDGHSGCQAKFWRCVTFNCQICMGHRSTPWAPSLTRVNHQLRIETLPMFYAMNEFQIQYNHFWNWIERVQSIGIPLPKKVNIMLPEGDFSIKALIELYINPLARPEAYYLMFPGDGQKWTIDVPDLDLADHISFGRSSVMMDGNDGSHLRLSIPHFSKE
ncbi:hypothetical protein EJ08DRAFT_646808 [Tothia fuscella]|uniref:Uncharacterized protein n=1 Tax=Tothia fuscella TaxID=1048955 RepID=A0A9P4NZC6_9PEZI|nr:hypothetical protein EJ08DRAFT_646808 [Tothia fuscella]